MIGESRVRPRALMPPSARTIADSGGTPRRTAAAHLRADPASQSMSGGPSQHEVGRSLADLGTATEKAYVRRVGVFPAELQAVHGRLNADAVTSQAVVDALLHFTSVLHGSVVRHVGFQ